MALGANIKRLRLWRGLTQEQLDSLSGVHVAQIEIGVRRSPRIETLEAIAKALGVTVATLYRKPRRRAS